MKILLLQNGREPDLHRAQGYGQVTAWFLWYELKFAKHEVVFGALPTAALNEQDSHDCYLAAGGRCYDTWPRNVDAVLACEQRAFANRSFNDGRSCPAFQLAREVCPDGVVATMCDNDSLLGPEDMTFFHLGPHVGGGRPGSKCVGMAASRSHLWIMECNKWLDIHGEPQRPLRILVDHPYYGDHPGVVDVTKEVLTSILRADPRYNIECRRFCSGGWEKFCRWSTITPEMLSYDRQGIPWINCAELYRWADVFVPTHAESYGMSVVEAAVAEAVIAMPGPLIAPEVMQHVAFVCGDAKGFASKGFPCQEVHNMHASCALNTVSRNLDRWGEIAEVILGVFSRPNRYRL